MVMNADPRTLALRGNVAAAHLRGHVQAAEFVDGKVMAVSAPVAALRRAPGLTAGRDTDLLFGEPFIQYGAEDAWVWGQAGLDGYVGYLPADAVTALDSEATHRVVVSAAHCYAAADLKSADQGRLSYGSRVSVTNESKGFLRIDDGRWIYARHLSPLPAPRAADAEAIVTEALKLLGTPYLWGGRSADGIDCSGLVQLALQQNGFECPRDSDQQEAALGSILPLTTPHSDFRAGDLLFFAGHVVIALGNGQVVHANATDMQVSVHALADVLARAEAENAPLRTIKRINQ